MRPATLVPGANIQSETLFYGPGLKAPAPLLARGGTKTHEKGSERAEVQKEKVHQINTR